MTDSMNFGPDWIRNLSSEGNTGGGTSGGTRYQLADYRYGREEMLALFDRNIKPPACLANFKSLFAETALPPLALLPTNEEERGGWQGRPTTLGGPPRGRGGSLERGGRIPRGRGGYQSYGRPPNYESGWGNGEPSDWSPRKEYNSRPSSMDNWRRGRNNEEDDGWRMPSGRGMHDKWGRSTSWRGDAEGEERSGPPERGGRSSWHEVNRGPPSRKSWDEDHLPEWATENPLESGGSFDDRGAFHGSDDEQAEGKGGHRKEGLQKSTSQQHISHKQHPPLLSSKSTMSLVKDTEHERNEDSDPPHSHSEPVSREYHAHNKERERKTSVPDISEKTSKDVASSKERAKSEGPPKSNGSQGSSPRQHRKMEDNDLEKLQEEIVLKLVVDEELPKPSQTVQNSFDLSSLPPPPNLTVPGQDKWFYQDPQGQMQGPFTNMEMSEWFKAGYFGQDLKVRRQCDERFFLLGELMAMCGGSNPFQTSVRFPVLKNDISKMPESDLLQFQYLSQLAAYKQAQARVLADPWSALTVQQQELAAQRLIMQQQQVQQDLQYMQQPPPTNPLMHMISQMQQANKLPTSGLLNKQPPNMTGGAMDPHLHMHMTNFLSLQNRLPSGLPNHIPAGMPGGVTGPLPPENMSSMSGLAGPGLGAAGIPIPGMPSGLATGLGLNVPRSSVEHNTGQDISSLLKQLQQKQQQNQVESLWQQSQFGAPNSAPPQQQWPGQVQQEVPMSMWDIQQSSQSPVPSQQQLPQPQQEPTPQPEPTPPEIEKSKKVEKLKEIPKKDDEKELKKKKKAEEEQQKKEVEEKRKQEQRKLEADKKAEVEKKKKEEEKIKKQLEKVKKEAEEKRLRELEEKRRLKEQRKIEEEEKKKSDEDRRLEEEERMQKEREQREREERQRAEERRLEQISQSKVAPWSQANSTLGMSLTEIQKAERERKVQEAALQAQRAQLEREQQLQHQQQQQLEKSGGIQLGWAKKSMEPRKVKSLAEIQAEEQERLTKEAAEARLRKEKEARETIQIQTTSSIWSGQNLSWSNVPSAHSQWSSATNFSGFWDEPAQKPQPSKPSTVSKSSSMSTISNSSSKQAQQSKIQQKPKPKKEEAAANSKKNHNNNIDDDFTNWCYRALSNITTTLDIPTFISFLRDIESAFEVKEYCKDYLGESGTTQQFANNFLEKRRSFKPKNAHKDDMCSPAPAITPSMQYSTEFQEVKGKNKKTKKSKMLKVDSRILGFNVTSAPDRINVGDRDYGDNS